jgi:hypothetical protein
MSYGYWYKYCKIYFFHLRLATTSNEIERGIIMRKQIILSIAIMCLVVCASPVYAALIDRGTGMIYDTDTGLTWIQDANYAKTSGYNSDGAMPYQEGLNWVEKLEYGGYSDWRLPFTGSPPPPDNVAEATSEMGHLYYVELGNIEGSFTNPGPFTNLYMGHMAQALPEDTPPGRCFYFAWSFGQSSTDFLYSHGIPWGVRDGDTGPSVSVSSDYITNLLLGDTFSFDYWWQMGQEPTGLNFDIMYFRDNSWQLLGGDINFDGSSTGWETRSFVVPENLRGLNTQIRFMVYDFGTATDPTVYLRNIASNGTAPVPEPSTMLLLGTGLLGLAGFRKKGNK